MTDLERKKTMGERLREVRLIFNEGGKLYVGQFARLLDESEYNIRNYEQGKAFMPYSLIETLFEKGINPIYLITGKGGIFADNQAGKLLKAKTIKAPLQPEDVDFASSVDELIKQAQMLKVRAGAIVNKER